MARVKLYQRHHLWSHYRICEPIAGAQGVRIRRSLAAEPRKGHTVVNAILLWRTNTCRTALWPIFRDQPDIALAVQPGANGREGDSDVDEPSPSVDDILAEWTILDPAADTVRWRNGVERHRAGLDDVPGSPDETTNLLCSGLTHYVANGSVITASDTVTPETMLQHTIWNVLSAALHACREAGLSADSGKQLRLALAAARQGGYQPQDLGGAGLMAAAFDPAGRALMSAALQAGGQSSAPFPGLMPWFTGDMPGPDDSESPPGSRWDTVLERARQAHKHVNPVALQHGIESVQGALTEAKIAKVDKTTGRLKIKKVGVARAVIQPTRTLRRAIDGAAVTEHLRAYNERTQPAMPAQPGDAPDDIRIPRSSAAEFDSYGSKRDYLRDWARRLAVAAAVGPTEELITDHADMAATAVRVMVFQRLRTLRGVDLSQYVSDSQMPALDTFDVLYLKVVESEEPQAVSEKIVAFLDSIWLDWIEGIRDHYS